MTKHNHTLVGIFALAIASLTAMPQWVQAQITLNQAAYSNVTLGLDSFRSILGVTITPSNNGMWDLTGATYGTSISTFTRTAVSGNATYPQATYSVPSTYKYNSVVSYNATDMNGLGSAGQQSFGQVIPRQAISLSSITMGPNDSLVINAQNVVYSAPKKTIAFPASAGSVWTSTYVWDLGFSLSIAAGGLNNAPGIKRTYTTQVDSVKGWGKMRVKNALGQNTGWIDVLAIKVSFQQKDSFFLNGAPASATDLAPFGVTQGQVSNQYYIVYNRAQELATLLSVNYSDANYTTPTSASVHARNLQQAVGVASLPYNDQLRIYPNPVSNGEMHIELNGAGSRAYTYELSTVLGVRIAGGPLNLSKGKGTIQLDQPAGTYFLKVTEDGKVIGVQQVELR